VEYRSHPIFADGRVIGAVVSFSDISARVEAQKDMWNKANYDELTTLPNRNLFYDRLEQAIAQSERSEAQVALLFIDLDGFKEVNDRYGHDAGDELLRIAAERLVRNVRDSDTVARMGGDEFTIVLPQVTEVSEVKVVAAKTLEQMSQPFMLGNREVRVSGSVGIALYPRDGGNGITLIKHADVAMYRAKESGRNAYRFFSDGDD
jgi:diguanylate cyclase (GGDEF)-like protein